LAGAAEQYSEPIKQFARNLGVAFKILNDLNDWDGDDHNKLAAGGDVLGGRPTLLLALALESLSADDQAELLSLISSQRPESRVPSSESRLSRVRQLYTQATVFDKATRLVEKHRERAEKIADEIQPEELRALLYYLIDSVLDHAQSAPPPVLTMIGAKE